MNRLQLNSIQASNQAYPAQLTPVSGGFTSSRRQSEDYFNSQQMASGKKFQIKGRKNSQTPSNRAATSKRPQTVGERTEQGLRAFRATKFVKKIDGHTVFTNDKDMDMWRKPWQFMYDAMLPADADTSFEHREFQHMIDNKRHAQQKWLLIKKDLQKKAQIAANANSNQGSKLSKKRSVDAKKASLLTSGTFKLQDGLMSNSVTQQNSESKETPPNETSVTFGKSKEAEHDKSAGSLERESPPASPGNRKSNLKTVQIEDLGEEKMDSLESSLEKRKSKKLAPPPGQDSRLPDYLRKSAKWQKLQAMNQDLNHVSQSVYKFDDFLRKVSKKMKIKDLRTIKDESYRNFQDRAEIASTESPRKDNVLSTIKQEDESSLDMGAGLEQSLPDRVNRSPPKQRETVSPISIYDSIEGPIEEVSEAASPDFRPQQRAHVLTGPAPSAIGRDSNMFQDQPHERLQTSPGRQNKPNNLYSTITTDQGSKAGTSKQFSYKNNWETMQDQVSKRLSDIDKRLEYLDNKDTFQISTIDNPPIIQITDHGKSVENELAFSFNSSFGIPGAQNTVRFAALSPLKPLIKGRGSSIQKSSQFGGNIRSIEISSNNRSYTGQRQRLRPEQIYKAVYPEGHESSISTVRHNLAPLESFKNGSNIKESRHARNRSSLNNTVQSLNDPLSSRNKSTRVEFYKPKKVKKGLENYMAQDSKLQDLGIAPPKYTDFAKLLVSHEKDDRLALKKLLLQKPLKTCKNQKTRKGGFFSSFGVPYNIYSEAATINADGHKGDIWKHKTRYNSNTANKNLITNIVINNVNDKNVDLNLIKITDSKHLVVAKQKEPSTVDPSTLPPSTIQANREENQAIQQGLETPDESPAISEREAQQQNDDSLPNNNIFESPDIRQPLGPEVSHSPHKSQGEIITSGLGVRNPQQVNQPNAMSQGAIEKASDVPPKSIATSKKKTVNARASPKIDESQQVGVMSSLPGGTVGFQSLVSQSFNKHPAPKLPVKIEKGNQVVTPPTADEVQNFNNQTHSEPRIISINEGVPMEIGSVMTSQGNYNPINTEQN